MFQSARPNSVLYILHKTDEPFVETGTVINQPIPKPKYAIPTKFGQPQEMVVDLVVKIGEQTVNYNNLPAQLDIADTYSNSENIVVADSREALNSEILSQAQKSQDIADSKDYHEKLAKSYREVYTKINPEYAEKEAQKEEIKVLREQMTEMSKSVSELMNTNRLLIEKLSLKQM